MRNKTDGYLCARQVAGGVAHIAAAAAGLRWCVVLARPQFLCYAELKEGIVWASCGCQNQNSDTREHSGLSGIHGAASTVTGDEAHIFVCAATATRGVQLPACPLPSPLTPLPLPGWGASILPENQQLAAAAAARHRVPAALPCSAGCAGRGGRRPRARTTVRRCSKCKPYRGRTSEE
jgi:hypothetical protein